LHVAVSSPHPLRFRGFPALFGCERAAEAMEQLARTAGFQTEISTDRTSGTRESITRWFKAQIASPPDVLLFTFAGHGARLRNRDRDEREEFDQALVCYDEMLVDDGIYRLLQQFPSRTLVVMIAECCYSGSLIGLRAAGLRRPTQLTARGPVEVATRYSWDRMQETREPVDAPVLLLAAAADTSRADGADAAGELPPFTSRLLHVWNDTGGTFSEGYEEWAERSGAYLTPLLRKEDAEIVRQAPFEPLPHPRSRRR
jgi:hypothetical protein